MRGGASSVSLSWDMPVFRKNAMTETINSVAASANPSSASGQFDAHNSSALRFITCGSVDDGKSTLIGRLLVDTRAVLQDQLAGVTKSGETDLALLTDGLAAEREQGITIDVAYRYFATESRKFIIGDAPGHEQYTAMLCAFSLTSPSIISSARWPKFKPPSSADSTLTLNQDSIERERKFTDTR